MKHLYYCVVALAMAAPGVASAAPTLTITGQCPGETTMAITDAAANAWVGLFTGDANGSHTFGGGPCGGTTLDIGNAQFLGKRHTDGDGNVSSTSTLTAFACGDTIQAMDLTDCSVSDVASNAGRQPLINPYTTYEGTETMDYEGYGDVFHMDWDIQGSPVTLMNIACENCVFMFEVTGTLDVADSWGYDPLDYFDATYGYSTDMLGNGESWVMNYYGSYYWWGYASFTATKAADWKFNYWYGYVDYPYNDSYYTYWQYGDVTVE